MLSALLHALAEVAALAVPTACASCGQGDESLCRDCRAGVVEALWSGGARAAVPEPCPEGMPPVRARGRYEGPLARLVTAYKDGGRRDVRAVLGPLLGEALDAALQDAPGVAALLGRGDGPVLLVPVPTSGAARRRRGDAPLLGLARVAAAGFGPGEVLCADALRMRRRVADQAGLSARQRSSNLEHAMELRPRWAAAVAGAHCVLVDDVLTTGATLVEARRAVLRGGAAEVVAATVCATARRHPRPGAGPGVGT